MTGRTVVGTARARAGRRNLAALIAMLITAAVTVAGLTSVPTGSAWALGALSCTAGRVYGISGTSLVDLSTTSGTSTVVADFGTTVNGLAITQDAQYVYAVDTGTASQFVVRRLNPVTGTVTEYWGAVPFTSGDFIIAGAINPVNGIYYYASIGNTAVGNIYAFDTTTNTSIGRVGSVALPQGGNNGDLIFDSVGNMYVNLAPGSSTGVYYVGQVATTAGSASYSAVSMGSYPGVTANGVSFDADGYIYLSDSTGLKKYNPVDQSIVTVYSSSGLVDLADCNYPGTIEVKKNVVSRVGTNQFTLNLSVNGTTQPNGTGTTAGTDLGLQDTDTETAGVVFGLPGTTYTFSESMASGSLSSYTTSYVCTNSLTGTQLATGTSASGTFTFPSTITNGSLGRVVCTFSNTARQTLSVTKALGATRLNTGDQFRVQIRNSAGTVVSDQTNAITAGTGAAVTTGTGTTGDFPATVNVPYTITEVAAGTTTLANYIPYVTCTDGAGVQTGLPSATPLGSGVTVTPVAGARIACIITNYRPMITVTKSVAGRVKSGDQFTVAVTGPGITSSSATTAGTATTASTAPTVFVPGSTYTITDSMATGSPSPLNSYTPSISCVDAANGNAVVTTTQTATGQWTLTPPAGQVNCTVTNTPVTATITLQKALSSPRQNNSNEFTVILREGSTTIDGPGQETSSGKNANINNGTGTTGAVTVTPGTTYTIDETISGGTYTPTVTCRDLNGLQTNLPFNATWTPGGTTTPSITPVAGANIYCLINNATTTPILSVDKVLIGGRVATADQFTVSIKNGNTTFASSTTSGSNSAITGGSTPPAVANSGTNYTINETAAGGSLDNYIRTVTCTDASTNTVLHNNVTLPNGGVTVKPSSGSMIACRITNTAKPTITVAKQIGGSGRVATGDQFTVNLRTGGATGTSQVSAITTSPSLSATSSAFVATVGTEYTITESAAPGAGSTDLSKYAKSISCIDASGQMSGLPSGSFETLAASLTPVAGAKITCTVTNTPKTVTVRVTKAIGGGGRLANGDQFTVQIKQGGTAVTVPGTPTTTGTGSTVTSGTGTTGTYTATAGTTYTISEAASGTTDLTKYTKSLLCSDVNGVQTTGLPTALDTDFTLLPGAAVTCTLTNSTPPQPTLTVTKEMGGAGRLANTDQFTVQIKQAGTVVSSTTNATTTGTGTTVTSGTGTTGTYTATAGTTYTISEAASGTTDLTKYTKSLLCSDVNGVQTTGLPTALDTTFTLVRGAAVYCVLTNARLAAPTLVVTKVVGGAGRLADTDQFTVQIKQGGTVVSSTTNATTTGTGSTVTSGTGTTGTYTATAGTTYTISEAASGTTDLTKYTKSLLCSDVNGVQTTGLPTALGSTFTLVGGAAVSCTLTNATAEPTLSVKKILAGGGRVTSTDQFTVQIIQDGSVVSSATNATTAGTGATVTNGTGTTGTFTATAGTTYTIAEVGADTTDLSPYTATITCTDSSGVTPSSSLPDAASLPSTGVSLSLGPLASVECTITNTSTVPVIKVSKQSSGCDITVTSCPLSGAAYALYTADPSDGTATAVTNGITVDTANGSAFTSTGLVFNTDYWLVETQAPDGFTLLAQPVKFQVSGTGITLAGPTPTGRTLITVSGGPPTDTIVIQDTPRGPLPKAGGRGPWTSMLIAAGLMAAAGVCYRRGLIAPAPATVARISKEAR